jgi:hypothetical protein
LDGEGVEIATVAARDDQIVRLRSKGGQGSL